MSAAACNAPVPVFLIHYAAPDWCRSAAESIRRGAGLAVQVVVVDNGGASLPDLGSSVRVVRTGANLGFTGGANRALQMFAEDYADAEACVIGSHDLHVDEDCLHNLFQALQNDPSIGVAGPVLEASPRSTGGNWRLGARRQSYDERIAGASGPTRRAWVSGTCMMIRSACAEDVQEFDTNLGSYLEDVDFCLRARDLGWTVAVVPAARAHGLGSASPNIQEMIARNRLSLLEKREGRRGRTIGRLEYIVALPGLIARAAWARLHGSRTSHLREAMALVRTLRERRGHDSARGDR